MVRYVLAPLFFFLLPFLQASCQSPKSVDKEAKTAGKLQLANDSVFSSAGRPNSDGGKLVIMRSADDLRGLAHCDTAYVYRLIVKGEFLDYRLNARDITSEDDSVTVLVTRSGQRLELHFTTFLDVKWFGATGNGTTDDYAAIQKAINIIIKHNQYPRTLFFPQGTYSISKPLICCSWGVNDYTFFSINLLGQETAQFTSSSPVAIIAPTFTNTFAIGFQMARSSEVKGLVIKGQFNPPKPDGDWKAYYERSYATWASSSGVRDSTYSPYAGIVIDPFRMTNNLPADGGYPGLSSYYRGSGKNPYGGSSGIWIRDCHIYGFATDIILSPNGETSNAEDITVDNTALELAKVAYASCQRQSKDNFIRNAITWDRVHTLIDNVTYGHHQGQPPYVDGWNIAGNVIQLFNIVQTQFTVSFNKIFTESLYRIGNLTAGYGGIAIRDSYIGFNILPHPVLIPYTHLDGAGVLFSNCTIRYYDDKFDKRMLVKGYGFTFEHCFFDDVPLGVDEYSTENLNVFSFKDCSVGQDKLIGYENYNGQITGANKKIIAYGDFTVSDGGILTTSKAGGFKDLLLTFKAGTYYRSQQLGSFTVSVEGAKRTGVVMLGEKNTLVAAGDYLVVSNPWKVIGKVTRIDRNTGLCELSYVPIGVEDGKYYLFTTYYDIAGGMFAGDITKGSNVITNVDFSSILTPAYIGQRLKIAGGAGSPVIDSIGAHGIKMSYKADFSQNGYSNPWVSRLPEKEKFRISCIYPPSAVGNKITSAYPVLFPAGTGWLSPGNANQGGADSLFICTSPGYINAAGNTQKRQSSWTPVQH